MAKIIVLQHVPYEILGTMDPLLRQVGLRIKYVNFSRHPHLVPEIEGYDGLVILGGRMNVDQVSEYPHLATEIKIIRKAMDLQIPILGICLGAQLIAKANGAGVSKHSCPEIGWYSLEPTPAGCEDVLLQHMNESETIFQWHGDTFEIPDDAVHLVKGKTCENQAFRIGENVYGFQFHLEVDALMIERWLNIPAHKLEIRNSGGKIDPDVIRAETTRHISRSMELSKLVFSEFCKMVGKQHPPVSFTSR